MLNHINSEVLNDFGTPSAEKQGKEGRIEALAGSMGGDYLLLELSLSPPSPCLFSISFYLSNLHSMINKICVNDFGICSRLYLNSGRGISH